MKKIYTLILILIVVASAIKTDAVFAKVTPTPTTSNKGDVKQAATSSADMDKIEKVVQMIASKTAELNLVEKRGILGTVKEVSGTQVTIEDIRKNIRVIDIDELTKFQGADSSKSFGISDLKQGDLISFVGLYNKMTKRLLARTADQIKSLPVQFEGVVVEKNTVDYSLKVIDDKGISKTIEVETSTKTKSFDKNGDLLKSGFSKIETDQRVLVTGYYDLKDKNIINADRIVHFLDLPPSLDMKKFQAISDSNVPVSTGSGKKLTPIVR
ncbi:hypothetical protein M1349_02810 [Patescibacteria group bacterium]|nr:hypothetical protein [Patescibacteria group bacterium]